MPQSAEGVLVFIGAVFFLIGLLGGGVEIAAMKVPPIGKVPRATILALGTLLLVVGLFRVLYRATPPIPIAVNTPAPIATPPSAPPAVPAAEPPTVSNTPSVAPAATGDKSPPAPVSRSTGRAGDIVAKVNLSNVSNSSFGLSVRLTNEGTGNFNARFRAEDVSVTADTGETYSTSNQTQRMTDQIGPNRSHDYTFFFPGVLNPRAKRLTLVLAQISDLSNLSADVPLGRDTASLELKGSLRNVGSSSFVLEFTITNEGGSDFIAQFRGSDISLADNVGGTYVLGSSPGQMTEQIRPNRSRSYSFFFRGALNQKATSLILRLLQLSGTPDVRVTIPTSP